MSDNPYFDKFMEADNRVGEMEAEIERLRAAIATPEVYAGVITHTLERERDAAIAENEKLRAENAELRSQLEIKDKHNKSSRPCDRFAGSVGLHEKGCQMPELPRYRSHKIVRGARILVIKGWLDNKAAVLMLDVDGERIQWNTHAGWRERFKGTDIDLGYYVVYEDGYESWSPSKAFEEGYTRIE